MRQYDEELKELQQQAAMKNRLEAILKELKKQQQELQARVDELAAIKEKEQLDGIITQLKNEQYWNGLWRFLKMKK